MSSRFSVFLPLVVVIGAGSARDAVAEDTGPTVAVHGSVEVYRQHDFDQPSNGITRLRGFDTRSGTITLSNATLGAVGAWGPVSTTVLLQVGSTPQTCYLSEPAVASAPGVGPSNASTWNLLQQAYVSWQATDPLLVEAGLFLSPIGAESTAVQDNWNWSRSNLFFGLPFYHTGIRATAAVSDGAALTLAVYDGWNSVVDDDSAPSVSARLAGSGENFSAAVLYYGGVERAAGAAEGAPWRHVADGWISVAPVERLELMVHADVGMESGLLGTSRWWGSALYARVQPVDDLYFAARGDWLAEEVPDGASTIFWPSATSDGEARVASATLTAEVRPVDHLSFRLEGRLDSANQDYFYGGDVEIDPAGLPIASRPTQSTATLGVVAWF